MRIAAVRNGLLLFSSSLPSSSSSFPLSPCAPAPYPPDFIGYCHKEPGLALASLATQASEWEGGRESGTGSTFAGVVGLSKYSPALVAVLGGLKRVRRPDSPSRSSCFGRTWRRFAFAEYSNGCHVSDFACKTLART